MPKNFDLLVVGIVLGCAAPACAPKPAPYPDVESFCEAKAAAECQVASVCAINQTTCVSDRTSVCEQDATAATAGGTRLYNQANAKTCVDAVQAAYTPTKNVVSITFAQLAGPGSLTDVCERVFAGASGTNGTCQTDYDCTGELICSSETPGSATKVCAPETDVATGAFCANPGDVCPTNQYCTLTSTGAAQCQAGVAAGAACSDTAPCDNGERCLGGVCADRAVGGGACTTNDDCSSIDPYCDPYAGNICTVGLTFATGTSDCQAYLSPPTTTESGTLDGGGSTMDSSAANGPTNDASAASSPTNDAATSTGGDDASATGTPEPERGGTDDAGPGAAQDAGPVDAASLVTL